MNSRARLFVTLEGYSVEGGFDRPGGPMTCYAPTIGLSRHVGPGVADDLWRQYENVLDFVPALGFAGVRLSVEWARLEPRQGQHDDEALRRYLDVIRYARSLGLDVTIALVDAVWPSWTGQEAWLLPWVVPHVLAHARRVVEALRDDLTGVVAFTQPQELVMRGFLAGMAPPWRKGAFSDARFANAQIEGIVSALGADEIVGPLLVRSSAVTTLDVAPEAFAEARRTLDVDEIYVRSLLRGSGPTSSGAGLLALHGDEWRVNAPEELLDALR
ncbi:MAG TPA: family 1 glycosylhydrolase [Acidimicrobiales bacterium]|nr:family 1 glycosylhydrolase [Acidimicrobiales bacterium]